MVPAKIMRRSVEASVVNNNAYLFKATSSSLDQLIANKIELVCF